MVAVRKRSIDENIGSADTSDDRQI